jgi:hypothetical protein
MADNATVSEDANVDNIDLLTTPLGPNAADADAPSDAADKGTDDAAAATDKPADDAATKTDAKETEAKDTDAKESQASDKPADDQNVEQQLTPEQQRQADRTRAQQEFQNRQRTRQQVAQQLDQGYGPRSEEDLIEQGMEPQQASVEALRQEMAYKEQRAFVAELNANMQSDAVNASNDFPVFNPNSKDFDPDFTAEVDVLYRQAARLQTVQTGVDQSGKPIEVITNAEVPLYDFYQRMAKVYSQGTTKGAQVGQQEMQQMISRTENPGGSSSTSGNSSDDLQSMEERLGNVVIT